MLPSVPAGVFLSGSKAISISGNSWVAVRSTAYGPAIASVLIMFANIWSSFAISSPVTALPDKYSKIDD